MQLEIIRVLKMETLVRCHFISFKF